MPEIEDANDAEYLVRSRWSVGEPEMYNFEVHKRGYTWIVTFETQTVWGVKKHVVHINANTGNILRDEML